MRRKILDSVYSLSGKRAFKKKVEWDPELSAIKLLSCGTSSLFRFMRQTPCSPCSLYNDALNFSLLLFICMHSKTINACYQLNWYWYNWNCAGWHLTLFIPPNTHTPIELKLSNCNCPCSPVNANSKMSSMFAWQIPYNLRFHCTNSLSTVRVSSGVPLCVFSPLVSFWVLSTGI